MRRNTLYLVLGAVSVALGVYQILTYYRTIILLVNGLLLFIVSLDLIRGHK